MADPRPQCGRARPRRGSDHGARPKRRHGAEAHAERRLHRTDTRSPQSRAGPGPAAAPIPVTVPARIHPELPDSPDDPVRAKDSEAALLEYGPTGNLSACRNDHRNPSHCSPVVIAISTDHKLPDSVNALAKSLAFTQKILGCSSQSGCDFVKSKFCIGSNGSTVARSRARKKAPEPKWTRCSLCHDCYRSSFHR